MSKISLLPILDPAQIDGSETIPVVKAGLNRRVSLTALIAALVQPFINTAKGWADAAAASAAALGITTQTTNDVVQTDQDANGRWWTQHRLDGTFRVQKLADARGNRLDLAITANAARLGTAEANALALTNRFNVVDTALALSTQTTHAVVDAEIDGRFRAWLQLRENGAVRVNGIEDRWGNRLDLQVTSSLTRLKAIEDNIGVPSNIRRLQRAYWDAPKVVRMDTSAPVVSFTGDDTAANLIANAVAYPKESPFIRRLGGPWVQSGPVFPGNLTMVQQNVVYLTANGAIGGNPQVELLIDAGVTQIEWKGSACSYVGVVIDGKLTATTGHAPAPALSGGGYRSHVLTLTASTKSRRVRLILQRNASFGEVRVNAGGRLLDPTPARTWSIYVLGDSITEGSIASRNALTSWLARFGLRIGADQIANGGVGGTGWVRSIATGDPAAARLPVILNMVNGGPPDALICALGINDPGTTQADLDAITAAVTAFMTTARAAAPHMPVIVFGPFGSYFGWGSQQAKQDAIFAAARQFPHVYTVDTGSWWSNPAEYQLWYDPGTDTTHPIDPGHEALSQKAFDAVYSILKGL